MKAEGLADAPASIAPGVSDGAVVVIAGDLAETWACLMPAFEYRGLSGQSLSLWQTLVGLKGLSDRNLLGLAERFELDPSEAASMGRAVEASGLGSGVIADARNLFLLPYWARWYPNARFLLFFAPPEWSLAWAAESGSHPAEALELWSRSVRALLQFHRRNRRRSVLINVQAALENPGEFGRLCREMGFPVRSLEEVGWQDGPGTVARYLAAAVVAGTSELHALAQELEASARPIGDGASILPSADEALRAYASGGGGVAGGARAEMHRLTVHDDDSVEVGFEHLSPHALRTENKLLLQQVVRLQAALDQRLDAGSLALAKGSSRRRPRATKTRVQKQSSPGLIERYVGRRKKKAQLRLIRKSGLFDEQWYLKNNPDVASSGMDPVLHYLKHGASEGRNPSPLFDSQKYLASPEGRSCRGENPLVHYLSTREMSGS